MLMMLVLSWIGFSVLAGMTEDDLFELYDKMIELDEFGILGLNKKGLLKIGQGENFLLLIIRHNT